MTEDIFYLGIKAVIRNSRGEILLLKVNPRKLIHNEEKGLIAITYWDIPGGRIEKGHTPEETLKREIKEEIGVSKIKTTKPLTMVLSNIRVPYRNDSAGLILYVFTCKINVNTKFKLSEEHQESRWFNPTKASRLLETKYPKEFTSKIKSLT